MILYIAVIVVVLIVIALAIPRRSPKQWKLLYSFVGRKIEGVTTYYAFEPSALGYVGELSFDVDTTVQTTPKMMEKYIHDTIIAKAPGPFKYAIVEAHDMSSPEKATFGVSLYDPQLKLTARSATQDSGNVVLCAVGRGQNSTFYGPDNYHCKLLSAMYDAGRVDSPALADEFPIGPGIWEYS